MLPRDMKHPLLIANLQRKKQQQQHHLYLTSKFSEMETLNNTTMLESRRIRRQWLATTIKLPQINSRNCLIVLAIFSTIQLLPLTGHQRSSSVVFCQVFEDLNSNKQSALGSQQQTQSTFILPSSTSTNRQQQQNANQRFQRPILSTRFAPSSAGSGPQQQQQPLSAQASYSASVFSEPPALPQVAGNSPTQPANGGGGVSNIEQLMKNALARTAQMNSVAAEPRQDSGSSAASGQQGPDQPILARSVSSDKSSESSEGSSGETQPETGSDEADKQTTAAQTTTTTANAHETVYSDQRFANLFARRNNAKKRIQPTEQVKAKPTLPSFIKSPPDPKQFSATQTIGSENGGKPAQSSGSNSFTSQRLIQQQQQQQGRLNLANQQKKAAITSNSAASAQNKRANALNGGRPAINPTSAPSGSRSAAAASGARGATGAAISAKPSATPSSNNPFSRSQGSSSDPANVIAMARKRLLANNALETAKLKQQQNNSNKPTATATAN